MNIICKKCGKTFHIKPSELGKKLFCSKDCYTKYQKEHSEEYPTQFKVGHSFSEESIRKMSEKRKGVKPSKETIEKRRKSLWKGGRKVAQAKAHSKRRGLKKEFNFIPLNDCREDGWVGHHLDKEYVIFIPEELHKSVWHSVTKNINMDVINDKVYEWFVNEYLKGD